MFAYISICICVCVNVDIYVCTHEPCSTRLLSFLSFPQGLYNFADPIHDLYNFAGHLKNTPKQNGRSLPAAGPLQALGCRLL